ncbi:MAG: 5,10-methylenetetrahydromethanopterin reductase [Candidatus Thorarchaeota archaeon]
MVRFGIEFVPDKPIDKITQWAKLAEKSGFDLIWLTDHYNNRNVWSTLTVIALNTSKVIIGPGVSNPYHMSPALSASAAVTLNEISNGRAAIGFGAGDRTTLNNIGIDWAKPVSAVVECIEYVRALTEGQRFTLDGKAFKIRGAKLSIVDRKEVLDDNGKLVLKDGKPVKRGPKIPIYAGAQGSQMLKRTAMVADGILVNASHPKDFKVALEKIREGAEEAGRNLSDIDIGAYAACSIGETHDEALKGDLRTVVAFIVASSPDVLLDRHGIDDDSCKRVRKLLGEGNFKDLPEAVSEGMLEAFSIVGDSKQCISRIEDLLKAGVTQMVIGSPIGPDKSKAIRQFGRDIIPHFKAM